jgi:hypothetical protein
MDYHAIKQDKIASAIMKKQIFHQVGAGGHTGIIKHQSSLEHV